MTNKNIIFRYFEKKPPPPQRVILVHHLLQNKEILEYRLKQRRLILMRKSSKKSRGPQAMPNRHVVDKGLAWKSKQILKLTSGGVCDTAKFAF